ncbi:MAG: adenosylhomocysteinase [bacterium]
MKYDVKSLKLASEGKKRIEWANRSMPVLQLIQERFKKEKPLAGVRVSACLHVTTETANLMKTLKAGGAEVALCASNPLSTQDDVAASLVKDEKISTFAIKSENKQQYYKHLNSVLAIKPHVTMDDGADLVSALHGKKKNLAKGLFGSTEETTTGVIRLKSLAKEGKLNFPVIAVNDALTKHLFDNRYGTGQSTIDGIIRATNVLLAGKNVVVAGYGWCGRGVAMRAQGLGAKVIITEIDPVKAIEATMDGFAVMSMEKACKIGDVFVTLTGNRDILDKHHFKAMKDGAIICNSGHFDIEINVKALQKMAKLRKEIRPFNVEYTLSGGKRIILLAEGRLINLASAEGHPAAVMDMSFAGQALSCEYMVKNHKQLKNEVYTVPEHLDKNIAKLKLKSMGIGIDKLTLLQKKYLNSWDIGT